LDIDGSLIILLLLGVAVASLSAGGVLGWHLRVLQAPAGENAEPPPANTPAAAPASEQLADEPAAKTALEPERVRELLGRIHQLTEKAAAGVGEHTSRVERISEEIATLTAGGDLPLEEAILSAATRLLEANECLQQELTGAQQKLDDHTHQIEAHMAEARTDGLVGIANRRAFDEEMSRQCAALEQGGSGFSLILLDIDHFKQFNDRHGHQAGDDVLKGVGRIVADTAGKHDFVARYGGEEFAIIVPSAEPEEGKAVAQQVCSAIAGGSFEFGGNHLQVTASLGLAEASAGDNPDTIVRRADEALYAAKKNGRNRTYFFDGEQCVAIDSICCEASAELVAAVRQELDRSAERSSDRRRQPRRPFPSHQSIAPYLDGVIPSTKSFRQVRCHDISPGGIAFLMHKLPEQGSIVVALGVAPHVTYLTARMTHSSTMQVDGQSMFLVGCRFTGRLELEPSEARPPADARPGGR
jgi:diguanylate cyclase (GGDEF)-like protein